VSGADLPGENLPKEKFLEILRAASGVQCAWITDKQDAPLGLKPGTEMAWIEVSVANIIDIGWDEERTYEDDSTTPPTVTSIIIGRRQCTIRCNAYSLDARLEAYDLCGRVRFAFNRQAIHDLYIPTMSLRYCEKTIVLNNETRNGRLCRRANIDLQWAYTVSSTNVNPAPQGYVLDAGTVTGEVVP
jgi:hypothetical protein